MHPEGQRMMKRIGDFLMTYILCISFKNQCVCLCICVCVYVHFVNTCQCLRGLENHRLSKVHMHRMIGIKRNKVQSPLPTLLKSKVRKKKRVFSSKICIMGHGKRLLRISGVSSTIFLSLSSFTLLQGFTFSF